MKRLGLLGLLSAVLPVVACGGEAPAPLDLAPGRAYAAEVESWRADRMEGLRRPDGWLSLAGLYWFEEGSHSIGADPASDLVLPAGKAAAQLGVLHRTDRQVRFVAAPDAVVGQKRSKALFFLSVIL